MSNNSESTQLRNSTYNVLSALGREADFLYSTVNKYIQDAQNDGNTQLVDLWNQIKQDKQRQLSRLMDVLEKKQNMKSYCLPSKVNLSFSLYS